MKKILKAINEGLIQFDDESFKKGSSAGEMAKDQLERMWIEEHTVDLGLPSGTRWAICNIGAENPSDYGLYFLWGDPTGHVSWSNIFNKSDYKWYDASNGCYTKYNEEDGKTELDLKEDPAYIHSNGMLVTPTMELYKELCKYCYLYWSSIDGIKGYRFKSKINNEYIFLPNSGLGTDKSVYNIGKAGYYLCNSLKRYDNGLISYGDCGDLFFNSEHVWPGGGQDRYFGRAVRGVLR